MGKAQLPEPSAGLSRGTTLHPAFPSGRIDVPGETGTLLSFFLLANLLTPILINTKFSFPLAMCFC